MFCDDFRRCHSTVDISTSWSTHATQPKTRQFALDTHTQAHSPKQSAVQAKDNAHTHEEPIHTQVMRNARAWSSPLSPSEVGVSGGSQRNVSGAHASGKPAQAGGIGVGDSRRRFFGGRQPPANAPAKGGAPNFLGRSPPDRREGKK
jgi:hypothetical protein